VVLTSAFCLVLIAQTPAAMEAVAAGALEGRPAPAAASPLQARIDAAAPGSVIEIPSGTYQGDLFIDRTVSLIGRGRPRLVGSGTGSVILVRAVGVLIEGVDIDGRSGGSLDRDSSGIHVAAHGVTIRDVQIANALFGVYLREADAATLERVTIQGVRGKPAGEQGSGIHVYHTKTFRLIANEVRDMRDGIYIQSADGGIVQKNVTARLRYGVHYMYSDDNLFEDNLFEDGAAGAAIMYSKRVTFRRNKFLRNRGFASVGLLLKDCTALVAEDNVIADNARGLFVEGAVDNIFRRNLIAVSDVALVLFASNVRTVFEGNAFLANQSPLELVGRRTDTTFDGNYWSDAVEPDLDGDGIRDRPYRISSVFDHFRGNLTAAELFARGPAARALGAAERAFPVLSITKVQDRRPLVRPPDFSASLRRSPLTVGATLSPDRSVDRGVVLSALAVTAGLGVLFWGRRRRGGIAS
jgi:nitrous oxidase accessory protein